MSFHNFSCDGMLCSFWKLYYVNTFKNLAQHFSKCVLTLSAGSCGTYRLVLRHTKEFVYVDEQNCTTESVSSSFICITSLTDSDLGLTGWTVAVAVLVASVVVADIATRFCLASGCTCTYMAPMVLRMLGVCLRRLLLNVVPVNLPLKYHVRTELL